MRKKTYAAHVHQLMTDVFGPLDKAALDNAWHEWVALGTTEDKRLTELLESDVREEFKARAVTLLLFTSKLGTTPFEWCASESICHDMEVPTSGRLLTYTAELVSANVAWLSPRRSALAQELYGRFIIALLERLPMDELGQRLLSQFDLNDPEPFWTFDDASGYNPFSRLMWSDANEEYKRMADRRMFDIVAAEVSGLTKPRVEHEAALERYAEHVQMLLGGRARCSSAFLVHQIGTLCSLMEVTHRNLFNDWYVATILDLLASDEHVELGHRFARLIMLTDQSKRFCVYNTDTMKAATRMLTTFSDDAELCGHLHAIIKDGKQKEEREAIQRKARKQEEEGRRTAHQNVIARMK